MNAAFFLVLPALQAATWTVDPHAPADFSTISEAIAAASDGDTIQVAAGSYPEDLVLGGRSLTIEGAGSELTLIEPDQTGIDASDGESLGLEGVGFSGGRRAIHATGALLTELA